MLSKYNFCKLGVNSIFSSEILIFITLMLTVCNYFLHIIITSRTIETNGLRVIKINIYLNIQITREIKTYKKITAKNPMLPQNTVMYSLHLS